MGERSYPNRRIPPRRNPQCTARRPSPIPFGWDVPVLRYFGRCGQAVFVVSEVLRLPTGEIDLLDPESGPIVIHTRRRVLFLWDSLRQLRVELWPLKKGNNHARLRYQYILGRYAKERVPENHTLGRR